MWRRRSAASAPEREETADLQHRGQLQVQTTATADSTVKVTLETPLSTADPTQPSQPPLSVSLSINRALTKWCQIIYKNNAFFPRCRIEALDPSSRGLNVGGSTWREKKKPFEPSDNASNHDVFPVTAVFGPSVAESRSSARVDGSQLHMRRDPAHSPIDRQRNASLLFPGLALTGTLCHIRLGLSCLFGTKNT